jgi:hypothetical protein
MLVKVFYLTKREVAKTLKVRKFNRPIALFFSNRSFRLTPSHGLHPLQVMDLLRPRPALFCHRKRPGCFTARPEEPDDTVLKERARPLQRIPGWVRKVVSPIQQNLSGIIPEGCF